MTRHLILATAAVAVLATLGAQIVDPVDLGDREGLDEAEFEVLLYEFRADLNDYLSAHRSPNGKRTLADLIAFNASRQEQVMPFFGQEILVMAQEKGPLTEEAYREALATSKCEFAISANKPFFSIKGQACSNEKSGCLIG